MRSTTGQRTCRICEELAWSEGFDTSVCLWPSDSKILTMQEMPSSDQKTTEERLKQKNGDLQHSLEKLPNGPEPAPSKLPNDPILLSFKKIVNV